MTKKMLRKIMLFWLWFAVARLVFFAALWGWSVWVWKVDEPPLILALSYWAVIESALTVIVTTILFLRQET